MTVEARGGCSCCDCEVFITHRLDVGQHAALSDGHSAQQLVELLVVADGQLQVAGDDAGLLVVAGRVPGQLQDLSGQILQHRRQVHRSSGADALGVVTLPQVPVHTAHGELEPGPGGPGLGLRSGLAAAATFFAGFAALGFTTFFAAFLGVTAFLATTFLAGLLVIFFTDVFLGVAGFFAFLGVDLAAFGFLATAADFLAGVTFFAAGFLGLAAGFFATFLGFSEIPLRLLEAATAFKTSSPAPGPAFLLGLDAAFFFGAFTGVACAAAGGTSAMVLVLLFCSRLSD
ncbi:hypothetical protein EYF80_043137 [Liparis tanakae]|uniref:Uncharacterized protein n=1 Tax=Liparis tanakae TaxID=230148 RepID=A0A4Z2FZB8_9TELE|nr:hypothetical protein EYF80_043137 [Liparis tanakae]